MPEAARRPAFAYRARDSVVHRAATGAKLAGALIVSASAVAFDQLDALAGLLVLIGAGYRLARLDARDLWRDARWLLVQGGIVLAFTVALRGREAWLDGLCTALQIVLFFLPMALVLRTTPSSRIMASIERALPEQLAFAVATSARFAPFFARELSEIVLAQRLRGARLAPRDLWRPTAWRDWLVCVAVPVMVRAIEVADDAATAAENRGLSPEGGRS